MHNASRGAPERERRGVAPLFTERRGGHDDDRERRLTRRAVQRASDGDGEAMGELYDRYAGRVYVHVRRMMRDRHDAEDITQLVFLRLIRTLDRYDERAGDFCPWLLRVARNLAIDELRRRRPVLVGDVFAPGVAHGGDAAAGVGRSRARRRRGGGDARRRRAGRARRAVRRPARGRRAAPGRRPSPERDRRPDAAQRRLGARAVPPWPARDAGEPGGRRVGPGDTRLRTRGRVSAASGRTARVIPLSDALVAGVGIVTLAVVTEDPGLVDRVAAALRRDGLAAYVESGGSARLA